MALVPDFSVICSYVCQPRPCSKRFCLLKHLPFSQIIFKCSSHDSELFINCIFLFLHSKGNTMARVFWFFLVELSSVCVAGLFLRVQEFTGFSGSTRSIGPLQPLFISLVFLWLHFEWFQIVAYWRKQISGEKWWDTILPPRNRTRLTFDSLSFWTQFLPK